MDPLAEFWNEASLSMDQYALTVNLALFNQGRHNRKSCFEIFYRKPCSPEIDFIVFGGTAYVLEHLRKFKFSDSDLAFIRQKILPNASDEFLEYLKNFDAKKIEISGVAEGQFAYPNMPLLSLKGDIGYLLLIEAAVLAILNVCSSAATVGYIYSKNSGGKPIVEFGLRRAHGINSAYFCSVYSSLSGLVGSSNIIANRIHDIPTYGTMSHAYITSYTGAKEADFLKIEKISKKFNLSEGQIYTEIFKLKHELGFTKSNVSELIAFVNFMLTFDGVFSALVDTYDVLKSGVPNFIICSHFLDRLGLKKFSLRLDSGDLIQLSNDVRNILKEHDKKYGTSLAENTSIMATNDINLEFLKLMVQTPNQLDILGIGTNLSNFKDIRPIGFVYKLVEEAGQPRFKLTDSGLEKASLPFAKKIWTGKFAGAKQGYVITRQHENLVPGKIQKYFFDKKNKKFELIELEIESISVLTRDFPEDYTLDTNDVKKRVADSKSSLEGGTQAENLVVFSREIIDAVLSAAKEFREGN